jgi:hypothetical protein
MLPGHGSSLPSYAGKTAEGIMQKSGSPDDKLMRSASVLKTLLGKHHDCFPHQLVARFPHIIERIVSVWHDPARAQKYFKMLMSPESRGGFPPAVYQEIVTLSQILVQTHPAIRVRGDVWEGMTR